MEAIAIKYLVALHAATHGGRFGADKYLVGLGAGLDGVETDPVVNTYQRGIRGSTAFGVCHHHNPRWFAGDWQVKSRGAFFA
jgi:hypothetical protein